VPLGGILLAAAVVGTAAWRWSRARDAEPAVLAVDPGLERRVDDELRGSALLAVYSVGLGVAFLAVGIFFARGMATFRWLRDHFRVFSVAGGAVLVALGLLLFFD